MYKIHAIALRRLRGQHPAIAVIRQNGTAAEITPVVKVDARRIGNGRPGPVTRMLQTAYFASVHGEAENHRDWLSLAG